MKRRRRVRLIKVDRETKLSGNGPLFRGSRQKVARSVAQLFLSNMHVRDQSALITGRFIPIDPGAVARINIANSASLLAAHIGAANLNAVSGFQNGNFLPSTERDTRVYALCCSLPPHTHGARRL